MKLKKFLIIVLIIGLVISAIFTFNRYKKDKKSDVKIPVLLYHNFVSIVPDEDPNDFNYINTP